MDGPKPSSCARTKFSEQMYQYIFDVGDVGMYRENRVVC